MPGDHAALSPSSSKRWTKCAGSIALIATCPPEKMKIYAPAGTVAHKLAEQLAGGELTDIQLIEKIGSYVRQEGFDIEITEAMIEGAQEYRDLGNEIKSRFLADPRPAEVEDHLELRAEPVSIDKEVWGTLDRSIFQKGNTLYVIDYKFGMGIVEPDENPQLAIYAIGMMDGIAGKAYDRVVFIIHQPRAPHVDGPVREWTASKEWLNEFRETTKKAAQATRVVDAPCVPGDWCEDTYCPARAYCPALKAQAKAIARVDFAVETPETAVLPDVSKMRIDELVKMVQWSGPIKSMLAAAYDRIGDELNQGKHVPGFMQVEAVTKRKIAEPELIAAHLEPLYDDADIYNKKLKGIGDLTKLIGKARFAEFQVQGWVVKPEGALVVVPTSDKREPVSNTDPRADYSVVGAIETTVMKTHSVNCEQQSIFDGFDDDEPTVDPLWPAN